MIVAALLRPSSGLAWQRGNAVSLSDLSGARTSLGGMPPLRVRVLAYSREMQSHPHAQNLPIPAEAFISLFDALSAELEYRECDHTLEKSMTWLAVHGYDVFAVTQWLKRRGGHCDCEVLLNVEPKVLGAE